MPEMSKVVIPPHMTDKEPNKKIIALGKKITDGEVEFKLRDGEMETIKIEEVVSRVRDEFQKNNIKL